jgi:hypothetical protein
MLEVNCWYAANIGQDSMTGLPGEMKIDNCLTISL